MRLQHLLFLAASLLTWQFSLAQVVPVVSGNIFMDWDNVKFSFQTLANANVRITKFTLLSTDYENIKVKCEGNSPEFAAACKCLVATRFPVYLVVNAVYRTFPCTINQELQKNNDIIKNYFVCSDEKRRRRQVDEECSIQAEYAIQSVDDLIRKIEPIVIEAIPPTKNCKITGLSGMQLTSGSDVTSLRNTEGTLSTFFVTFPNIKINCEVQLSVNPARIPISVLAGLEAIPENSCPAGAFGPATPPLSRLSLADLLKLTECQPSLPSIPEPIRFPGVGGGGGISIGRR